MEDSIDGENEAGAAFLDVHMGCNDEGPVAHAQIAHRYATRADEATAEGQHDVARNLHLQASKSFLAAAGMPRADPGESFAMTASAASETPAAATATADDAASVNQSEASSLPADGLVAHGLLLLARSHARAAEQAHWRSRLQKKEQGDEKAKSGRTSSHNNKTASTADGASTAGTSAGAMGTARRARGANGDDSGAAAELWPRSTHVSALSSPPPSPPRKGPSKPPSHSQTSTDALEDSVMGAPISNRSKSNNASKRVQETAVAHSVAREFLALEQSLKRFGAKPLRQPPTTSANNNNTSNNNSGSNSGRGFSGFKSLSPFLKGNSSSAPASPSSSSFLRRNTGGSSGHLVGSTLTSLAEEEPPSHERGQSDEPSYNRGHGWPHNKGFGSVNLGSSFSTSNAANKNQHLSSLLGESFLELGSTYGNWNSNPLGNNGIGGGIGSGSGIGSSNSNSQGGRGNEGGRDSNSDDPLSHSLFSMAVGNSPRGGSGSSGGVGRFVSSQELQGQAAELARCLRLTQLLHDENAKLLEDRETYQRAASAAAEEKAAVERFKVEYRELFAKVKDEMLRFRAAYPHPNNPASAVPSEAETQLVKLAQAYERKDRKFKEAEVLRAKTTKKLEVAEATLKRYETAFQQLKERAADKERLRQQQEKQHHASPLSSPTVVGQNVDTASVKGCTSTGSALAAAAAASASAAVSGASVTVNGTASGSSLPRSSGSAPLLAPAVVAHTASAPRKPSI